MVTIKGIDPKMIANNLEPSEPTHPGELQRGNRIPGHFTEEAGARDRYFIQSLE